MDNCWLAALVPHKRFRISVESAHDLYTDMAYNLYQNLESGIGFLVSRINFNIQVRLNKVPFGSLRCNILVEGYIIAIILVIFHTILLLY